MTLFLFILYFHISINIFLHVVPIFIPTYISTLNSIVASRISTSVLTDTKSTSPPYVCVCGLLFSFLVIRRTWVICFGEGPTSLTYHCVSWFPIHSKKRLLRAMNTIWSLSSNATFWRRVKERKSFDSNSNLCPFIPSTIMKCKGWKKLEIQI